MSSPKFVGLFSKQKRVRRDRGSLASLYEEYGIASSSSLWSTGDEESNQNVTTESVREDRLRLVEYVKKQMEKKKLEEQKLVTESTANDTTINKSRDGLLTSTPFPNNRTKVQLLTISPIATVPEVTKPSESTDDKSSSVAINKTIATEYFYPTSKLPKSDDDDDKIVNNIDLHQEVVKEAELLLTNETQNKTKLIDYLDSKSLNEEKKRHTPDQLAKANDLCVGRALFANVGDDSSGYNAENDDSPVPQIRKGKRNTISTKLLRQRNLKRLGRSVGGKKNLRNDTVFSKKVDESIQVGNDSNDGPTKQIDLFDEGTGLVVGVVKLNETGKSEVVMDKEVQEQCRIRNMELSSDDLKNVTFRKSRRSSLRKSITLPTIPEIDSNQNVATSKKGQSKKVARNEEADFSNAPILEKNFKLPTPTKIRNATNEADSLNLQLKKSPKKTTKELSKKQFEKTPENKRTNEEAEDINEEIDSIDLPLPLEQKLKKKEERYKKAIRLLNVLESSIQTNESMKSTLKHNEKKTNKASVKEAFSNIDLSLVQITQSKKPTLIHNEKKMKDSSNINSLPTNEESMETNKISKKLFQQSKVIPSPLQTTKLESQKATLKSNLEKVYVTDKEADLLIEEISSNDIDTATKDLSLKTKKIQSLLEETKTVPVKETTTEPAADSSIEEAADSSIEEAADSSIEEAADSLIEEAVAEALNQIYTDASLKENEVSNELSNKVQTPIKETNSIDKKNELLSNLSLVKKVVTEASIEEDFSNQLSPVANEDLKSKNKGRLTKKVTSKNDNKALKQSKIVESSNEEEVEEAPTNNVSSNQIQSATIGDQKLVAISVEETKSKSKKPVITKDTSIKEIEHVSSNQNDLFLLDEMENQLETVPEVTNEFSEQNPEEVPLNENLLFEEIENVSSNDSEIKKKDTKKLKKSFKKPSTSSLIKKLAKTPNEDVIEDDSSKLLKETPKLKKVGKPPKKVLTPMEDVQKIEEYSDISKLKKVVTPMDDVKEIEEPSFKHTDTDKKLKIVRRPSKNVVTPKKIEEPSFKQLDIDISKSKKIVTPMEDVEEIDEPFSEQPEIDISKLKKVVTPMKNVKEVEEPSFKQFDTDRKSKKVGRTPKKEETSKKIEETFSKQLDIDISKSKKVVTLMENVEEIEEPSDIDQKLKKVGKASKNVVTPKKNDEPSSKQLDIDISKSKKVVTPMENVEEIEEPSDIDQKLKKVGKASKNVVTPKKVEASYKQPDIDISKSKVVTPMEDIEEPFFEQPDIDISKSNKVVTPLKNVKEIEEPSFKQPKKVGRPKKIKETSFKQPEILKKKVGRPPKKAKAPIKKKNKKTLEEQEEDPLNRSIIDILAQQEIYLDTTDKISKAKKVGRKKKVSPLKEITREHSERISVEEIITVTADVHTPTPSKAIGTDPKDANSKENYYPIRIEEVTSKTKKSNGAESIKKKQIAQNDSALKKPISRSIFDTDEKIDEVYTSTPLMKFNSINNSQEAEEQTDFIFKKPQTLNKRKSRSRSENSVVKSEKKKLKKTNDDEEELYDIPLKYRIKQNKRRSNSIGSFTSVLDQVQKPDDKKKHIKEKKVVKEKEEVVVKKRGRPRKRKSIEESIVKTPKPDKKKNAAIASVYKKKNVTKEIISLSAKPRVSSYDTNLAGNTSSYNDTGVDLNRGGRPVRAAGRKAAEKNFLACETDRQTKLSGIMNSYERYMNNKMTDKTQKDLINQKNVADKNKSRTIINERKNDEKSDQQKSKKNDNYDDRPVDSKSSRKRKQKKSLSDDNKENAVKIDKRKKRKVAAEPEVDDVVAVDRLSQAYPIEESGVPELSIKNKENNSLKPSSSVQKNHPSNNLSYKANRTPSTEMSNWINNQRNSKSDSSETSGGSSLSSNGIIDVLDNVFNNGNSKFDNQLEKHLIDYVVPKAPMKLKKQNTKLDTASTVLRSNARKKKTIGQKMDELENTDNGKDIEGFKNAFTETLNKFKKYFKDDLLVSAPPVSTEDLIPLLAIPAASLARGDCDRMRFTCFSNAETFQNMGNYQKSVLLDSHGFTSGRIVLEPSKTTDVTVHEESQYFFVVEDGEGIVQLDNVCYPVEKRIQFIIPNGCVYQIKNNAAISLKLHYMSIKTISKDGIIIT